MYGPRLRETSMKDSGDLRAVVQVQIRLLGHYPIEVGRLNFGEHISKDL